MDAGLIAYLDRRFEQVDRRFEQIDRRFDRVDQRFEHFDQRFRELHVLVEAMDDKIGLVAEGVLANTDMIHALRADMNREFEEVKVVNRLSYAELDRRWREHDRRITDLEAR